MLNIALPKGRLGNKVFKLLNSVGYSCKALEDDDRRLIVESEDGAMRFLLVKPSDIAIYVEHGAADVGIVGKDILLETNPDVYELLDLGFGKCRMCVAAPNGYEEDKSRTLRVATKFVHIAKNYYSSLNREIDLIKLNGSIELAPIIGLSDVIVDIVESGSTLRNNNMSVVTEILPISARLIANKTSFRFKSDSIEKIVSEIAAQTEADV